MWIIFCFYFFLWHLKCLNNNNYFFAYNKIWLGFQKILPLILLMCQYTKNVSKIVMHFAFNLQVNPFLKPHKVTLQSISNFTLIGFCYPEWKKHIFQKLQPALVCLTFRMKTIYNKFFMHLTQNFIWSDQTYNYYEQTLCNLCLYQHDKTRFQ